LILLLANQLLNGVFGDHKEVGAGVVHCGPALLETTLLRTIIFYFLRDSLSEDGQVPERVERDQNGRANLREDILHFLVALANVVQHDILAEVVQLEQVVSALHVCLLHSYFESSLFKLPV